MTRAQKMFTEALIMIGLLGAIWIAVERVMVEQTNRTVGMAVDWGEVEKMAAMAGVAPRDVLVALQSGGATHLAVAEQSMADLINRGEIKLFSRGAEVDIMAGDPGALQQLARGLGARFPGSYQRSDVADGEYWLTAPGYAVTMLTAGAGYPRRAVEAAEQVGLTIVARPIGDGVRTPLAVQQVLQPAADTGARIIVFSGENIVGFPGLVEETAAAMQSSELTFGMIELAPQNGEAELATRLDHRLVRVHSITEQEMNLATASDAAERFVRAARERGVRLLYLRMLPAPDSGLLDGNARYLDMVRSRLRAATLQTGTPQPAVQFETAPWKLAIVKLAVCGALLWVIQALFALEPRHFWSLAGVVLIGGALVMLAAPGPARLLAALMAAALFPTMAVGWTARSLTVGVPGNPTLWRGFGRLLATFLAVSIVTILGGILIVGLLGDSAFLVKVAQFRGVKFATVLPIVAVALIWLGRSTEAYRAHVASAAPDLVDYRSGETIAEWPALWAGLKEAARQVIVYWHVAAAVVALAVLAMMVLRTGNEASGAVLPMEMELRSALDRLLVVRPRTKEVFVGHPILLLAILLAMRRVRPGIWIAFAIGTIGQVSLLNSFCHVHKPLPLTLLRVFNGLWIGAIGGIILCALWDIFGGAPEAAEESPPLEEEEDEEQP